MTLFREKKKATLLGLLFTVVLAGCSSNSANVSACTKAEAKLTESRNEAVQLTQQDDQISAMGDLAALFTGLSTDFSVIASSASGDVADKLNSAANASANVASSIIVLDSSKNEEAINILSQELASGGALDIACQASGAKPFTTGW